MWIDDWFYRTTFSLRSAIIPGNFQIIFISYIHLTFIYKFVEYRIIIDMHVYKFLIEFI